MTKVDLLQETMEGEIYQAWRSSFKSEDETLRRACENLASWMETFGVKKFELLKENRTDVLNGIIDSELSYLKSCQDGPWYPRIKWVESVISRIESALALDFRRC